MKNRKHILALALVLFTAFSCNERFLEPEIKTDIDLESFGATPPEGQFLLTQAYINMRNDNFVGSVYWSWFPTDYSVPNPGTTGARSFIARMSQESTDSESFAIWGAQYRVISSANLTLEKAEAGLARQGLSAADQAEWSRIAGEARFTRSLAYFNLVRLFRNVPIIEKFFKSFDDINSVANGAQMKEHETKVYEFIVADLEKAITTLPIAITRGRANRYAAHALLGKVFLQMASIEKFRDKTGVGTTSYTKAIENFNVVINSNVYGLKTYFPDNFIRTKQYTGANEFLFTLEFNETDKGNFNISGNNSGFFNNAGTPSTVFMGVLGSANGSSFPTDHGWSVYDLNSPGDIVRRFWTFEDGEFRTFDANGDRRLANTLADCPNGQGPNCEVFLKTQEPYPFTRPYWFETIADVNAFRNNPSTADVVTLPNGQTTFSLIWGGGLPGGTPNIKLVKFRRNPVSQATYTDATYDADYPVMRYAEVLLMYAEAANELGNTNSKPANGKFSALEAANLIRDRARNFVFYSDLSVTKTIIDNSPFRVTYGDVFSRQAKIGSNPAPARTANAADTLAKYYNQISAFRGLREVPSAPVIRNFKEFPATRNFVPDYPATLSQTGLREELLDERWRELAGEANARYFDLARYGRLISGVQTAITTINPLTKRDLTATPFGQNTLRVPDEKYTYFPIPKSEIDRNPNLKQNPGY
jgi:hypothetical protein